MKNITVNEEIKKEFNAWCNEKGVKPSTKMMEFFLFQKFCEINDLNKNKPESLEIFNSIDHTLMISF